MRIVSKAELLTLPKGTLFADYRPESCWPEGPSMVLVRADGDHDFLYRSIGSPDAISSDQLWDRERELYADTAVTYPMDLSIGREGMYEPDSTYLVWEPDDVKRLINVLLGNDDPKDFE